jgi:hypothetical protein
MVVISRLSRVGCRLGIIGTDLPATHGGTGEASIDREKSAAVGWVTGAGGYLASLEERWVERAIKPVPGEMKKEGDLRGVAAKALG